MDGTLLIVDDDRKLQALLSDYLTGFGFRVEMLLSAEDLVMKVAEIEPVLIILDVMLPGTDGLEALKRLRHSSAVPVIMLTARGDETDRIVGLELGSDDYLAKPFNPRELLARIKAILRRSPGDAPAARTPAAAQARPRAMHSDGLTLDRTSRIASSDGVSTELSSAEVAILETLMLHANEPLTRDAIMNSTRGRDFMAYERSIDVHVSRIRAKLSELPGQDNRIRTVWGTGYVFEQRDEP